ncbi:hypothetical protein IBA8401_26040 [Pseudomonas syringae]
MYRQLRLAVHHLHRLRQAGPMHRTAQDIMAVDNRLQALKKSVKTCTAVELDRRAHKVGVAFMIQQVMKQDAFLKRCQRIDVLDIGGSTRNGRGNQFNLINAQFHQRQHVWR